MGEEGGKKERRRSEEGCGRVCRLRTYRERARRDTRRVSRATYPYSRSLIRCSTSSYAVERHLGSQGGGGGGVQLKAPTIVAVVPLRAINLPFFFPPPRLLCFSLLGKSGAKRCAARGETFSRHAHHGHVVRCRLAR